MKYYQPESLDDYWDIRSTLASDVPTVLAGGTDLMPRYERGVSLPDHLIDLKHIDELNRIRITDEEVKIGALTNIQNLHDHPRIQQEFTALYQAAYDFAGAQIRHRGTIGGNICNASPAGDLLPGLYAFGASLQLAGPKGTRELPISEFILGPGKTVLMADEILTEIVLKRNNTLSLFEKAGLRQSMAISVVNLAIVYKMESENFTYLKICAGAVAPTVVTLDVFTDSYLKNPAALSDQMDLVEKTISPIDDIRATAEYRKKVLKNLIQYKLSNLNPV